MRRRSRSIIGRMAHAGAFTLGAAIAERLFRSPGHDVDGSPWPMRVGREEVLALGSELEAANEARLGAMTRRLIRALLSGVPRPRRWRLRGRASGQVA